MNCTVVKKKTPVLQPLYSCSVPLSLDLCEQFVIMYLIYGITGFHRHCAAVVLLDTHACYISICIMVDIVIIVVFMLLCVSPISPSFS